MLQHFSSVRQMSVLFNDTRFNPRPRPRSRSTTGLWLSVVMHVMFGIVLIVVPIRASEKPSAPRPRSMRVFTLPAAEPVKLPSVAPVVTRRLPPPPAPAPPVQKKMIADVPKPVAVAPIATKPVAPAPALLPPAAAPTFERPVETRAPE